MGRCCVPNCRGNYDNGPKVRLFSFPRDAKRRAEWQRAVRRSDVDVRLLKDPKVCERHFKSEHLRTTSTYTDCDGRTIEAPMKLTRLTPDAFPAIFPDCPSYISNSRTSREEPELKRKRTENELLQKAIHESQAAFEKEEKQYKVCNLGELISRVNERPNKKFWCTTACETCLIVAHIEPALQAPEMLVSVVVTEDLSVSVYFKCAPLVSDDVCIPDEVRDVRVLDNLLDSVERYCEKKARQQEDKVGGVLRLVLSLLDDICDDELHDDERADALIFLKEQCKLLTKKSNGVRFCPSQAVCRHCGRTHKKDSQCEETPFCVACQAAGHIYLDPNCPTRAFRATSPPLPKKNAAAKSNQGEQPEPLDKNTGTPPKTWSQVKPKKTDGPPLPKKLSPTAAEDTVQANPATQPRVEKHNELQRTPSTLDRKSSVTTDQALDTIMQLLEKLNSRMEAIERAMAQQEQVIMQHKEVNEQEIAQIKATADECKRNYRRARNRSRE
ncbi:hypothetical protein HPB52_022433 [Rhipicephalus sanguineus]|uniref:THAP-type domain-containing protein n=1 Tax=Rhipicephalus sanguineus TaxID=34632 RepID=A0A9D4PE61_RHISA|nr:hypothetical protein HPB52_022433 [Rhipicephalus sanguineus]